MATEKKAIDWSALEIEYRAGIKSLEQIGKEFGVTKGRISQVATKKEWKRDLKKRIQAKADAKVNEAAVNEALNAGPKRLAEAAVVDANAEVQYRVRMEHRTDIGRSRKMFASLMSELESMTDDKVLFDSLGKLMAKQAVNDINPVEALALKGLYQKVMSLPNRAATAKQLVEILEKTVKLEREAFGIDDNQVSDNPVDTLLRKIYKERIGG